MISLRTQLLTGLILAIAFLLPGCYGQKATQPNLASTQVPFNSKDYESSVDNFVIILDASRSMINPYKGEKKIDLATQLISRINQTLPEMNQKGALRSFGHSEALSEKDTVLVYGMEKYSKMNMHNKLNQIPQAGGSSPMHTALDASGKQELKGVSGKTAVIIISDGNPEIGLEPPITLEAARALKNQVGENLEYYPILIGDNEKGSKLINDISRIGNHGFVSNSDNLMTEAGMNKFVEDVFLTQKTVAKAPAQKEAVPVAVLVPGKLEGTNIQGIWVVDEAYFDFDESTIKPGAFDYLDEIAQILKKYPQIDVRVEGHTDNIGPKGYNDELSERRARAVQTYLTDKGIDKDRLLIKGYGYSEPAVPNTKPRNRALNRRVELHPVEASYR